MQKTRNCRFPSIGKAGLGIGGAYGTGKVYRGETVTHTKTSIAFTTESTYDWENEEWSVPLIFSVAQMLKIGPQILQVGASDRYWADSPGTGRILRIMARKTGAAGYT